MLRRVQILLPVKEIRKLPGKPKSPQTLARGECALAAPVTRQIGA